MNIPIINIIAISAELTVTVQRALMLQNLDVIEQKPNDIHGIDNNIVLPILRYRRFLFDIDYCDA